MNGGRIVAAKTKTTTADDCLAKAKALLGEKLKMMILLANKALNFEEKELHISIVPMLKTI